MKRVVIVLLPLFAAAPTCGKNPASTNWASPDVQRWAPPPQVVEYDRINVAGPFSLPDVRIRDEWHGPVLHGEVLLYDIKTFDVTEEPPELLETVRHFFGPGGYGYIGTLDEEGTLEIWDPPQVVLPTSPSVGLAWSGTHKKGESTSVRSRCANPSATVGGSSCETTSAPTLGGAASRRWCSWERSLPSGCGVSTWSGTERR
jgi:hypothetical protein